MVGGGRGRGRRRIGSGPPPPAPQRASFSGSFPEDPATAIIGGGMSGLACAWALAQSGLRCTVFDTGAHCLPCFLQQILQHSPVLCGMMHWRMPLAFLCRRAWSWRATGHPFIRRWQPERGAPGPPLRPCVPGVRPSWIARVELPKAQCRGGVLGGAVHARDACACAVRPPRGPSQTVWCASTQAQTHPSPALLSSRSTSPPPTPPSSKSWTSGRQRAWCSAGRARWAGCEAAALCRMAARRGIWPGVACASWQNTWRAGRRGSSAMDQAVVWEAA